MITDEELAAMEWRAVHNDGPWPTEAQRDRRRLLTEIEELRDQLAAAADVINAREG